MPDLLPKSSQQPSSGLLLRGDKVTLGEWLEVSWFYPEGFRKERVIETERSWIVLGSSFVYKFLKVTPASVSPAPSREQFRLRWRSACEEVIDNRALAPELYIGLRLLRWVDEEPQWISEKPNADLDPQRPPAGADDVAIVMRRLTEGGMLHRTLEDLEDGADRPTKQIAAKLREFHRNRTAAESETSVHDPDGALQTLRQHYLERLNRFVLSDGSYLDAFSQLALQEIRGYLGSYFAKHQELFRQRIRNHFFQDGHGSLRADRICFSDTERGRAVSVFGRLSRNDPSRYCDQLRDIAALAADVEARGFPLIATELEEIYFKDAPHEQSSELYRFYKVAEAVTRAQLLFRGKVDDSKVQATAYLSLAFRLSLRLKKPFLVVIGGTAPEAESDLAKSIAELADSASIGAEDLERHLTEIDLPDELLLKALLEHADHELRQQRSVVLQWPLNREEERLEMTRFAERLKVPYLLVQCELGKGHISAEPAQAPRRRVLSNAGSRYTKLPDGYAAQIVIEPVLPPAELALHVLKQIPTEIEVGFVRASKRLG